MNSFCVDQQMSSLVVKAYYYKGVSLVLWCASYKMIVLILNMIGSEIREKFVNVFFFIF